VSLFWIRLSRGPPHDECCCVIKQYGGQFIVMQPDCLLQFNNMPVTLVQFNNMPVVLVQFNNMLVILVH